MTKEGIQWRKNGSDGQQHLSDASDWLGRALARARFGPLHEFECRDASSETKTKRTATSSRPEGFSDSEGLSDDGCLTDRGAASPASRRRRRRRRRPTSPPPPPLWRRRRLHYAWFPLIHRVALSTIALTIRQLKSGRGRCCSKATRSTAPRATRSCVSVVADWQMDVAAELRQLTGLEFSFVVHWLTYFYRTSTINGNFPAFFLPDFLLCLLTLFLPPLLSSLLNNLLSFLLLTHILFTGSLQSTGCMPLSSFLSVLLVSYFLSFLLPSPRFTNCLHIFFAFVISFLWVSHFLICQTTSLATKTFS